MAERIFPGVSIEALDGKLSDVTAIATDTVLVIDRSYKGPIGTVYKVASSSTAATVFGADSPIIKSMGRAFAGGAKNVALYRVGGATASVENIFGLATTLETVEASESATENLKVYIGPEPTNPQLQAIIAKINNNIVYSNTLEGTLDLNKITVDGFSAVNNEVQLGSYQDLVPFDQIVENLGTRVIVTDNDKTTLTIPSADLSQVSKFGIMVKVNGKVVKATTDFTTGDVTFVTNETTFTAELSYVKKYTKEQLEEKEIKQKAGQSLVNSTWKQYYEALDTALTDIQDITVASVVGGDVFNVPNIADGSNEKDRLEYVNISENELGERVYEWSAFKKLYRSGDTTTEEASKADLTANGLPIVSKQFNEVDFVHRLGMWGYTRTTTGTYPNIVVGALPPKALNSKYINLWVGREPVYDSLGKIIVNGTGLLGHRLMVGTITRAAGYFATGSGFPDGDVVSDSGGAVVDLGKYLSIVVNQTINSSNIVKSAAASYAGLLTTITPGNGSTNQVLPNNTIATELKQGQLKTLQSYGYVVLQTRSKGVTVVSGNLATRLTSDYRYVSTSIMMNAVVADINDVAEPFIGKGLDGVSMVALQTALNGRMAQRQVQGYFKSFNLRIIQSGVNTLSIAHTIEAKDELRRIENTIELKRTTTYN